MVDALKDSVRKRKTIEHLLANKWNVENLSYFPFILFENDYWQQARNYMLYLTDTNTNEESILKFLLA